MARPSSFTAEVAERVCNLVAIGESVRAIGDMDGMPTKPTIRRWLSSSGEQFEAFRAQYARACELRAAQYADEIVDIADDPGLRPDDKRVRIDARKWIVSKMLPKVYGDAVTVRGDADNPLQVRTTREMSDEELMALAAGGLRGVD